MKEYKFKVNGKDYTASVDNIEENIATVTLNGVAHAVELEKAPEQVQPIRPVVRPAAPVATPAPSAAAPTTGGPEKPLKSPLPGVVLDLFVGVGDAVKSGQKVMMLEAMKMENVIDADRDGVVKVVKVKKGDSVNEGDVLIIIG